LLIFGKKARVALVENGKIKNKIGKRKEREWKTRRK
jgi:hypothetical protein